MRHKKILVLLLLFLGISVFSFIIYQIKNDNKINYVALGDSIARGRNPYGVDGYGYTDYLKDYLQSNKRLGNYNTFAVSGYKINDVLNDINNNVISSNNQNIKVALRESDLVTLSIGANDFIKALNVYSIDKLSIKNFDSYYKNVDEIVISLNQLINEIKKYAKNDIYIIGYYNPIPYVTKYQDDINKLVKYADKKYENICKENNIQYIKISNLINQQHLPNPIDIHPNIKGYVTISKEIIKYLG